MLKAIKSFFDIIDLEDGDAKTLRLRRQIEQDSRRASSQRSVFCERKDAEHKGICQGCKKKKDFLRFILDCEMMLCYDCYYHDMQLAGEFSSYHGCRAEDMDGFLYDDDWEFLWAKENPHMEYDEEECEYYDKNKPRKRKTKEELAYRKSRVKRVWNDELEAIKNLYS